MPTNSTEEVVPSLDDWLHGQRPEFLLCRRWGHAWLPWRYVQEPEPGVVSRTILRCHRCKQKAFDDMDDRGYTERAIDYADDYLAPRGFGRLTREDRAVLRLVTDAEIRNNLGASGGK